MGTGISLQDDPCARTVTSNLDITVAGSNEYEKYDRSPVFNIFLFISAKWTALKAIKNLAFVM